MDAAITNIDYCFMTQNNNINSLVDVFVEIEQFSNMKYEFDKKENKLILDRILEEPFVYPFAYGFIPNTLADDMDELDALIISYNKNIKQNNYYKCKIIGGLIMEDEKGMDEKILCVLEEEYDTIKKINYMEKNDIHDFFTNYKNKNKDKWSRVHNFVEVSDAINLYEKYKLKTNLNINLKNIKEKFD